VVHFIALPGQNVSCFVMGVVSLEAPSEVNNSNIYGHLKLLLLFVGSPYGQCLTYLFIPWNGVLPDKLIGLQLVKKFPTFYGTRRFITAFRRARHLSLTWTTLIPVHTLTSNFLKIHL